MSGWIKMHRSMMNHWCSTDPNFLAVWLRLLFDANYEDKKSLINGTIVEIKRGQVLFGLPSFAKRSGVTVSKLRSVIKVLSDEHMIDRQTTNKYSIISITKYDQYQMDDRQNTNKTQTKHKQNTTSKEINNLRTKEEDICDKFFDNWVKLSSLTNIPSIRTLSAERKKLVILRNDEAIEFGTTMSDVFRTVLNSKFLNGSNGEWRCTIDWFLKKSSFTKIIEGNYDKVTSKRDMAG